MSSEPGESPTAALLQRISGLSPAKQKLLLQKLKQPGPAGDRIGPSPLRSGLLPCSFGQRRLWFLDQLEPGGSAYNVFLGVNFEGPLEVPVLIASLETVVARHEVLRTSFPSREGEPFQAVDVRRPVRLPLIDLSALPEGTRSREADRLLASEAWLPFDLLRGPLLRHRLLRLSDQRCIIAITMHHIISDGWSLRIFAREMTELYDALRTGRPARLPALAIQYADFADWQRRRLTGAHLDQLLDYWRQVLRDAPALLELPADRPRPPVQSYRGSHRTHRLSAGLTREIKRLARAADATLFITLLAAFQALLYRYSGQTDLAVGTPVAGRIHLESENLIGLFVNTLVLRCNLDGNPEFRALLARTRQASLDADAHQELPFEKLVEELQPVRSLSYSPLFQVMFSVDVLQAETDPRTPQTASPVNASALWTPSVSAQFDLSLTARDLGDRLLHSLEFATDLFDGSTIVRLLHHFEQLLTALVENPDRGAAELSLLSPVEHAQLAREWNDTGRDYGTAVVSVHQLIEAQAARAPAAPAVVFQAGHLSYGELNRRANRLAGRLRGLAVGPEVTVGICLERSLELVVAVLAVLKAGGAYVPLDPAGAPERLAFMLADVRARVVISVEALRPLLPGSGLEVVCLDSAPAVASVEDERDRLPAVVPASLAYIIYTSGSTGRPKGVMISQGSLLNACLAWLDAYRLTAAASSHLQLANFTFDVFTGDFVRALCSGAKLVLCPREVLLEPAALYGLMRTEKVDCAEFVPAVFRNLVRHLEESRESLDFMRILVVGADVWYGKEFRQTLTLCGPATRLINSYGVTEVTIDSSYFEETEARVAPEAPTPIGRPFGNNQLYVLGAELDPVPIGLHGELFLGGPGLARGYLGRPDLTAERFVPDPFSATPGGRLYRTGDRSRCLADGVVEFLGRVDFQVKIRGYRIEPGEIETVLGEHPALRQAVVVPRPTPNGDQRLVAYVVPEPGQSAAAGELAAYLRGKLPEYMVPSAFVGLASLPLTANGKVDRKALPAPDFSPVAAGGMGAVPAAPATPVEEVLSGIWSVVLGVEGIGRESNFFELGGHSLLATQLISRVRGAFRIDLALRTVFEAPSLRGLAERVEAALRSGGGGPAPPVIRRAGRREAPLSFAQQRLWFLDQLEPGSPAYNLPAASRLRGAVRREVLAAALSEVVRRHESLRTRFDSSAIEARQVIAEASPLALPLIDLQGLPAAPGQRELRRLAQADAERPFDLARGPLLRVSLVRLGAEEHAILLTMHHIVSDGWSMGVLLSELSSLYAAFSRGRPSPLARLPVQYADYAEWQRGWLSGAVLAGELGYWRGQLLAAPPVLELAVDRPRPAARSGRGASRGVRLGEETSARLQRLARGSGSSLFMTLLAGFQALLSRLSGQEDVSVGSPIAGRTQVETEGLIGFFVNTLVLRSDLSGDPPFEQLLGRVRETVFEAHTHQEVPFEKLVEELRPERSLSSTPLFQALFVLQNTPRETARGTGLSLAPMSFASPAAKFDLTLSLAETARGLAGELEYATDLFDAATIDRLAGQLSRLLESAVESPSRRLSELSLWGEAQRAQVLVEWNDTGAPPGTGCLHELIWESARRHPEVTALVAGADRLSYRELTERAARMATALRRRGVGPEVRVGVLLERSADLVVALLGVLAAGGAYVPLDPSYPAERLEFMVADAGVELVVTAGAEPAAPWLAGARRLRVEEALAGPADLAGVRTDPGNLAYLIYTSGSTGRPKAVGIEHRGAVALVAWAKATFSAHELCGVLASTSVSFDLSVFELFVPLALGGTVILASNALELAGLAAREEVRLVNTVPSVMAELLRLGALPSGVETVNLAGEALSGALAGEVLGSGVRRLLDLYGPSEDTTYSTGSAVGEGTPRIGRPILGTRAYVLDRLRGPVPLGVAGELYLGGAGLARGYLGRPELTAERFIPDAWSGEAGGRLYRTGDLVRWQADGELDYLGRIDHQVKLRGFRIELGEIESALRSHPRVAEAVAMVREDRPGDRRLVAYVVGRDAGDAVAGSDLRAELGRRLPAPMVPSAFVGLASLPLTANGKVDRKALPAPDFSPVAAGGMGLAPTVPAAPATPVEEVLSGIWSVVLGVEGIGRESNFFELGGHSLLATQLISRVRSAFRIDLALRTVFEAPSLRGLAERVEAALRSSGGGGPAPPVIRRAGRREAPLSFAQQRLWFLDQLEPGSPAYNLPAASRLRGAVRREVLAAALSEVVRRHESLRTRFDSSAIEARQVIAEASPLALPLIDLQGLPAAPGQRELRRLAQADAERPFDLARGPLLRVSLVRLGAEEHAILLTMHHIVSDGWSMGVLLSELSSLYAAFSRGRPSPLARLPVQYADYAEWQRGWLSGAVLAGELGYWRGQLLAAPPVLELAVDRPRPAARSGRGASRGVRLGEETSARLQRLARGSGSSLFMTLLAGFQALLSRLSGQEDVSVGSPIAGRMQVETEGLIGFFVNTLVLRSDLSGDPPFEQLLGRVRETVFEAHTHQEVPFEKLVEELRPERSLSSTPLFQVLFVLQNTPRETARGTGLSLAPMSFASPAAKFDLTLSLAETARGLAGELEYATDLFDAATIDRLAGQLSRLLESAVESPSRRLSELSLWGEAQRAQVLVEWNDTGAPPGTGCLHELIWESARRHPEVTALVAGADRLSYRELTERAARMATALRRRGVGPEVRVGVLLERSADLVVALLGVLAAGGAYVPLDPSYPAERLEFMVADAGVELVVTAGAEPAAPWLAGARRLRVEEALAGPADLAGARTDPGNLAYLIYTSGSTGRPKAVGIEHRGAVALVAWAKATFSAHELCGVLASTSVSFDLSVFELFVPLALGGTVILASNALELAGLAAREEVRLVNTVPSVMAELLRLGALPSGVETVNLAGEALSGALAGEVLGSGVRRLLDLYGPSEDTTYSTGSAVGEGTPRIGRPILGTRAYVLDRLRGPVPLGVAGELYLGGAGLARGYLGRPELTAERFVPDAWSGEAGGRLYRTGDLVRWQADGELDYLGRIDHQVKLRGFRIELGEIESALRSHPRVAEAVAMVREDRPGDRRLVAYVVGRDAGAAVAGSDLRAELGRRLPAPMVPSAFVGLASLPLTANGKVDRKALPAPEADRAAAFVAPRDPLEAAVAGIWEELLERRPVGATDDFFALGGHSLLAVRLFVLLRRRLGRELPLATLFRASTVERLALALGAANRPSRSDLVEIQAASGSPPFFCVHPVGGNVLCYLELARALGPDQPVYGLQRIDTAELTLEELASHYVAVLRTSHPQGGYRLGGWSMGGVVAFEMARQLERAGERVEALVLIDAQLAVEPAAVELEEAALVRLFTRDLAAAGFAGGRGAPAAGVADPDLERAEIEPMYRLFRANYLALQQYRPAGAWGGAALLVGNEGTAEDWHGLLAGPVTRYIPGGDHYSLLRRPQVEILAGLICGLLNG